MVPALRLAQAIQPRAGCRGRAGRGLGKYGFRIVENQVDSDLRRPRICATFSEEVLSGGSDYASFVTTDQGDPIVTSEGRADLCRGAGAWQALPGRPSAPGLTAASGEELVKPAELTLYVRDRSPAVRFPGRGYILPASGEVALPITGGERDRGRSAAAPGQRPQPDPVDAERLFRPPAGLLRRGIFRQRDRRGSLVGQGHAEHRAEPGCHHAAAAGRGDRRAEAGDLCAAGRRFPARSDYDNPAATQWFVVSDLGLASISGNDGLHVFARVAGECGRDRGGDGQPDLAGRTRCWRARPPMRAAMSASTPG